MALLNFNAETVEPNAPFEPIPAGVYVAQITDSEIKESKAGHEYLALTFEVLDGEFKGRKLWDNLNLSNPNETTKQIAERTLSSIVRSAFGHPAAIRDSSELHNKPLKVRVVIQKDEQYGDKNQIKGYEAVGGKVASSSADSPTKAKTPWGK